MRKDLFTTLEESYKLSWLGVRQLCEMQGSRVCGMVELGNLLLLYKDGA